MYVVRRSSILVMLYHPLRMKPSVTYAGVLRVNADVTWLRRIGLCSGETSDWRRSKRIGSKEPSQMLSQVVLRHRIGAFSVVSRKHTVSRSLAGLRRVKVDAKSFRHMVRALKQQINAFGDLILFE